MILGHDLAQSGANNENPTSRVTKVPSRDRANAVMSSHRGSGRVEITKR
jgi:hypothetical protein